jgi:glucose/arabinose dehydrogenase
MKNVIAFFSAALLSFSAMAFTPKVAKGFKIEPFITNIKNARSMVLSGDSKYLFVGTRNEGNVYAVELATKKITVIAKDLNMPNGVAIKGDDLYVAEVSRVLVFKNILKNLPKPKSEVFFAGYPKDTHHGWKYIAFGPDGNLYIPVGAPCNICEKTDPYASLTRLNMTTKKYEVIARGIRNTVGFDWDAKGNLWFTENGRDYMGDDIPPCEINRLEKEGEHFGYPYCHGNDIKDTQFGGGKTCASYSKPQLNLGAHTAPLGMHFYRGNMFAPKYRNGFFVAEHGSWNRSKKSGYRVFFFALNGQGLAQTPETIVDGFLDGQDTLGRPVAFATLTDGSLLISDDHSDQIWRLSAQK